MKKRFVILLSVMIAAGALFNPAAKAIGLEISIGDRPYYQGRDFWDYGWHWVWVSGHFEHHRWVHGYYERRGDWNREHARKHHRWHHHYEHR